MNKIVIGLIGTIGSGKDTVSDYMINKMGFSEVSIGDLVREVASSRHLEPTRDVLQQITFEFRKKFGEDYWSRKAVEKVNSIHSNKIVLNGIRRTSDVECAKNQFGKNFFLILVDAKPEIRFNRMKRRNRPGDPKTLAEFKRQEKNEYKLYGDFDRTLKLAKFKILNNSTKEDTFNQTDKLIKKILSNLS